MRQMGPFVILGLACQMQFGSLFGNFLSALTDAPGVQVCMESNF